MRHRVAYRKLGRKTEHRLSLLRNLTAGLVLHERIRTTLAKAKELRPFAERLITLGKKDSLHARRQALRILPRSDVISRLFREVSPRFAERPGGYTRILKLGPRRGDGTPMAFIQLVDYVFSAKKESAKGAKEAKKAEKSEEKGPKKEPAKEPRKEPSKERKKEPKKEAKAEPKKEKTAKSKAKPEKGTRTKKGS